MNAKQRRIATRATARALPVGEIVVTPTGAIGYVIGHAGARVAVKYRNNRTAIFPVPALLKFH